MRRVGIVAASAALAWMPGCQLHVSPGSVDPPGAVLTSGEVSNIMQKLDLDLYFQLQELARTHAVTPAITSHLQQDYAQPHLSEVEAGFARLACGELPRPSQVPMPHNTIEQLITSRSDCIYFEATRDLSLLSRLPGNQATTRWVTMVPGPLPPTGGPGNDTGWSISGDSGAQDQPCPAA